MGKHPTSLHRASTPNSEHFRRIVPVWCHDRQYFLDEVCLLETAKWHAAFGIGPVDVLILKGYEIASEFSGQLEDLGYQLHDGSHLFAQLCERYARLRSIYPEFLFTNFMRWLAIDDYFRPKRCACFDADLVLTSGICDDPAIDGSTFTSTSTCFVVINSRAWFDGYREIIVLLNDEPELFASVWSKDVDPYVLQLADAFHVNEETLVRFLVKTQRVPNSYPSCEHIIAPFLLWLINGDLTYTRLSLPISYERKPGKGDFFNQRPLAYLHFQFHFKEYLAMHLLHKKVFGGVVPRRLEPFFRLDNHTSERPDVLRVQKALKQMAINGVFGKEHIDIFTRRRVMQEFLFDNDLRDVFSSSSWYEAGVFV